MEFWMEDIYTPGYGGLLRRKEATLRRVKVCKLLALIVTAVAVILIAVILICTVGSWRPFQKKPTPLPVLTLLPSSSYSIGCTLSHGCLSAPYRQLEPALQFSACRSVLLNNKSKWLALWLQSLPCALTVNHHALSVFCYFLLLRTL